jgi:hypothetical protein
MPWKYSQSTGTLLAPDGELEGVGYSGNTYGLNSPSMQDVPDVGPCPQGEYTMGPWFTDSQKGPIVTHLIPNPLNAMYGRSGFMIHGDNPAANHTASDGCIILAHAIRLAMSTSADQSITVTS